MNKNKNKKIIIASIVLIFLIIVAYLLNGDVIKNNTEVVRCSIENEGLYSTSTNIQKVTYVNDVFNNVEIEQHVSFKANALKVSLDELKNTLDSNLQEKFKILSDLSNYNIELDNEMLIMKLNITAEDYKKISLDMKESDNIIGSEDDFYDDKKIFINQIESQGGECTYE